MLRSAFLSMETGLSGAFRPELTKLRKQFLQADTTEMELLVTHLRTCIDTMPPSPLLAHLFLMLRLVPSTITMFLLMLSGIFPWSMLPLVLSEVPEMQLIITLSREQDGDENLKRDSIQLMLYDSPLLHVWTNLLAGIYCLECSITMTNAVATGAAATVLAQRLR